MKRPLVVKLGSALVVDARGRPRRSLLRARAAEIAEIADAGTPVCVVSSGAIALGLNRLGLERRPSSLPRLQAASALGQAALQRAWQDAFRPHGVEAAQILLTSAEIGDRRAYVNVRSTLQALFALGAVPVVNENDATATDEIAFGDNDALAAQVAVLLKARLLVLLTSVAGVLAEGNLVEDGAAARAVSFGPGERARARRHGEQGRRRRARGGRGDRDRDRRRDARRTSSPRRSQDAPRARASPRRRTPCPRSSSGSATASASPAGSTSTRARARRSCRAARACWRSASSAARARSRRATASSSSAADAAAFARGIASVDAAELAGRRPGLEAVHRDRLVLA